MQAQEEITFGAVLASSSSSSGRAWGTQHALIVLSRNVASERKRQTRQEIEAA